MKRKIDAKDAGNKRRKRGVTNQIIEPGWSGIYATCIRGKEKPCQKELMMLFNETVQDLHESSQGNNILYQEEQQDNKGEDDVESQLKRELKELGKKDCDITPIDIECECLLFFRVKNSVDAVQLVKTICKDAKNTGNKKTRYCQRFTPISLTDSATIEGLKRLAPLVLKPHFHKQQNQEPWRFAIKPTCRNHSVLSRDEIIRTVAESVGNDHGHKVDLKNYEKLILVDCFKSSLGMSVVDKDYRDLESFNIQRISEVEYVKRGKEESKLPICSS